MLRITLEYLLVKESGSSLFFTFKIVLAVQSPRILFQNKSERNNLNTAQQRGILNDHSPLKLKPVSSSPSIGCFSAVNEDVRMRCQLPNDQ